MIHCILLNPTIDKIFHVPELQLGYTYNLKEFFEFPVGKAISVALTVREFSEEVFVVALIGKEEIPIYDHFLNMKQIKHYIILVEGRTRQNITIIDEKSNNPTHFRMPGFSVTDNEINQIFQYLETQIGTDDYVVFSGSCPKGTPIDLFIRISFIISKKKANLVIDTSGAYLSSIKEAKPRFIKGNLEEIVEVLGQKLIETQELTANPTEIQLKEFTQSIRMKLDESLWFIILTLGKYGALLVTKENAYYSQIQLKDAPYTVGSGDAFLGGLLIGLQKKLGFIEILKIATACGAANTQKMGAGILDKEIAETYIKEVKIKEIEEEKRS